MPKIKEDKELLTAKDISEESKLSLYCADDNREYMQRCRSSKSFRELCEDDRDVFRRLDISIVDIEEKTKETYVFMTEELFLNIKKYAGMKISENGIRSKVKVYGGKWSKLKKKYLLLETRIKEWGDELLATAVEVIAENVINNRDVNDAKWLAERLDRKTYGKNISIDYSKNVNHSHTIDEDTMDRIKELRSGFEKARNGGSMIEEKKYGDVIDV